MWPDLQISFDPGCLWTPELPEVDWAVIRPGLKKPRFFFEKGFRVLGF